MPRCNTGCLASQLEIRCFRLRAPRNLLRLGEQALIAVVKSPKLLGLLELSLLQPDTRAATVLVDEFNATGSSAFRSAVTVD
jgi:hypothetical protein